MLTRPNCKINIGLNILRRRPDGYHDLQTIFYPIPLTDELEITPMDTPKGAKPTVVLTCQGIPIPSPDGDNLCVKAFHLLCDIFPGRLTSISLRLQKSIPFGAGLGGGSADASFTLRMLNDLFHLGLSPQELRPLAARLGADCPFFIDNRPAIATGIGDILTPIQLDLSAYRIVLIKPSDSVGTREAYAHVHPTPATPDLAHFIQQPPEKWKGTIINDFEASVFPAHPKIAQLKQKLYDYGAIYASMTGSGAAVYGLFPKDFDYDPIRTALSSIASLSYYILPLPPTCEGC